MIVNNQGLNVVLKEQIWVIGDNIIEGSINFFFFVVVFLYKFIIVIPSLSKPKLSKFELDVEILGKLVDETLFDWRGEGNVVEFVEIVENNVGTISRLAVVAKRLNLQVSD